MRREHHDARQVVIVRALLLLREVPNDVAAPLVDFGHHVEVEGVHVVVEGLVVQEELREVAQVLAPHLGFCAVDLEDGDVISPVDLVARRVSRAPFSLVALELGLAFVEVERELANVQHVNYVIPLLPDLAGERREVPRLDNVLAHLDLVHVLDLRHLLVLLERSLIKPFVVVVPLVRELIEVCALSLRVPDFLLGRSPVNIF
mmetsp:Transcript_13304/g.30887  ORF Transcript_13304/g.30887 Transcript_13304/m.30887 type:complete len:203 (+) Transcript_13304:529-1137(+)